MYAFISYAHIDKAGYSYLMAHHKFSLETRAKRQGREVKGFSTKHVTQDGVKGIRIEPMFDLTEFYL